MADLITPDLVDLDLAATERGEATKSLAERLQAAGRVTDLDQFLADVRAREAQMATGIEGGIGIPHCRSVAVTEPTLAFGRSAKGIDWGAADGPAHLIFLIAPPVGGGAEHMGILAKLARKLIHPSFRESLHQAKDPEAVVTIVKKEVLGQ
jgi:PTS system fructose-specific IIA component